MPPKENISADTPLDALLSPDAQEQIRALEKAGTVRALSPLQAAAVKFIWPVLIVTLLCFLFLAVVWYLKLPGVPPTTATPEQLAAYREETNIANDAVKDICETVFTKGLYPLLMLGLGLLLGRKTTRKDEDDA